MNNKKFLVITLIILAIGFAAVSTTLYISAKTLIGINTNDFEVYFSSAILDDVDKSNELITNNKKEINFTTSLTKLNEASELEFEITNASTQYDADVTIECTLSSTDYLSYSTDKSMYEVKAQTRETGILTVKLDKVSTEELTQTISCTLIATAKELSTAADVVLTDTTYQITGTGKPNTTYVVYSDTPHIVETDDYGFFYVNGLEKGSHEIYYLGDTSEDLTTKTKDEIKSLAVDKANVTTSSTSIKFANGNELTGFEITPEDPQEITLTLDGNGGSINTSEVIINQYTKVSDLEVPSRNLNYEFAGWYDGNKKITDNTIITSDMNLQAKWNYVCNYSTGQTWTYSYTGSEQLMSIPCSGTYKIELWGAQGGTSVIEGGHGAYTVGNISLLRKNNIYFYVGAQGTTDSTTSFNGGGSGGTRYNATGGGGATDVRLVNGTWSDFDSLKSRIMVAAGGGGSQNYNNGKSYGAAGGTLNGISGISVDSSEYTTILPTGGTQTSGGIGGSGYWTNGTIFKAGNGYFGIGGLNTEGNAEGHGGGGGGGYYGGGHGSFTGGYVQSGASGSSFISGYEGCNAIAESSTSSNIIHTGQSVHYSGLKFTSSSMIAGNASMPTHDGSSTMTGNTGNGYAKITLVSID